MGSQKSWALKAEQRLDLWGRRHFRCTHSSVAPEIRLVGDWLVLDAWFVM